MGPTRPSARARWPAGAALLAGAVVALGFAPLPIGGRLAVKSLNAQVFERTGLTAAAAAEDVRLTLLPFPRVTVSRLVLAAPDGRALARIAAADAYLRPLDLVGGRFGFSGFSLREPVFDAASGEARAAWRKAGAQLLDNADPSASPPPVTIAIVGGRVLSAEGHATDVAANIAWEGPEEPFSVWARGRWRGEEAEVQIADIALGKILKGQGESPARLTAWTPFGSVDAQGVAAGGATPRFDGDVRLGRWLDATLPLAGVINRYTVEGRVAASPRGFSSSAITIDARGGRLEGTLALRLDAERPQISGTLASQSLDFDSLTPAMDSLREASGAWSADGFDPSPLRRNDADIRLSAARVRLLGAKLEDAAISIMLKAGKLEFVLGRAQAYDGALRGRATLQALDGARVDARLQGVFENLDMAAASQELLGRRLLSGRGQGQAQIEASGASPDEIARQTAGKIAAQVKDGEISGVGLLDAARRPDRIAGGIVELGRGSTGFSLLDMSAALAQGVAVIPDGSLSLKSDSLEVIAGGRAMLADQSLLIDGRARAKGLPIDGLPFTLRGPVQRPELRWNLSALFNRS